MPGFYNIVVPQSRRRASLDYVPQERKLIHNRLVKQQGWQRDVELVGGSYLGSSGSKAVRSRFSFSPSYKPRRSRPNQ